MANLSRVIGAFFPYALPVQGAVAAPDLAQGHVHPEVELKHRAMPRAWPGFLNPRLRKSVFP